MKGRPRKYFTKEEFDDAARERQKIFQRNRRLRIKQNEKELSELRKFYKRICEEKGVDPETPISEFFLLTNKKLS